MGICFLYEGGIESANANRGVWADGIWDHSRLAWSYGLGGAADWQALSGAVETHATGLKSASTLHRRRNIIYCEEAG